MSNNIPTSKKQSNKFFNEVIVKGLSFDIDENDIGDYLDKMCGPVSSVKLLKNTQGHSKGIAFVSFETEEGCNKALELNNSEFMGIFLIIEKTKPKTEKVPHLLSDEASKTSFISNLSLNADKFSNEVILKNLSFVVDEKDIGNYFEEKCGTVTRINILKNEQGYSKGIAFVYFETEEGCNKSIELNNSEFMGRKLTIEKAKPKTERPAQLNADKDSKTIFVGNLDFHTNEQTLKDFFTSCGKVVDALIAKAEGKSRGFGHVEFEDKSGVENALKKSGEHIDGRSIRVDVPALRGKLQGFNKPFESNNSELMGGKIKLNNERPVEQESKTIFVGNLSFKTDEETLLDFFTSCGKVVNVRIARYEGKSKGFGHVQFEDKSGVENALQKSGEYIDGRVIKIAVA
ncbi:hypothetical protein ABPG72_002042 [Tetrahymena utriculariae]